MYVVRHVSLCVCSTETNFNQKRPSDHYQTSSLHLRLQPHIPAYTPWSSSEMRISEQEETCYLKEKSYSSRTSESVRVSFNPALLNKEKYPFWVIIGNVSCSSLCHHTDDRAYTLDSSDSVFDSQLNHLLSDSFNL